MSVLQYFGMIAMEIFNSLVSMVQSFFRDTEVRIYKCPKEQLYQNIRIFPRKTLSLESV